MAELTFSQAITNTIIAEMRRDPTIFTYSWSHPSKAMVDEFGMDRVQYSAICETQEAGAGIGAALAGMRPIVNLSMCDFAADAWGQIIVQAAKVAFEGGYKTKCPVVFRTSYGAWGGQSVMHSNCYHGMAANAPGLQVVVPSNAYDVVGLYRTALRTTTDPVIIFENSPAGGLKKEVPDADYTIPFGQGAVQREGKDVTIVGVGYWVQAALDAAADLEKEGILAEVWDPRTLIPLDRAGLLASVQKTGALVVVDQAPKSFGPTAEFLATVAEAVTPIPPMARVATMDVPIGFAPTLEAYVLPSKDKIIAAVKAVLARKSGATLGGGK